MNYRSQDEIMKNWPKVYDKPVVTILCMVYNHAKYIEDCIKGFLIQETNFPFEIFIHDDASTDESPEIIRRYTALYPKIFKPLFEKENLYSKANGELTKVIRDAKNNRGKYVAICEGDDYWIDPLKLQKQVDYLESHPDCGLVRTEVNRFFQKSGKLEECFFTKVQKCNNIDTLGDYIWNGRFAAPCSWLFRRDIYNGLPDLNQMKFFCGDILIILQAASLYKIHFMNDVTAVYRVLEKSASHFVDPMNNYRFMRNVSNTREYYARRMPIKFRIAFFFHIERFRLRLKKYVVTSYVKKWLGLKMGK
ncbi:glycosyltransferase [Fibrobacter sp.]|uniref:glycosyltransferase family 2 protein n=1 Tax=Fibrobacter sp. TaxID=35828 RepID=UPI0025C16778|nr:glycosyltransferase [Fibrobacter sp.]MBR3073391.1 glycosyltransferase [Fibrobacter sp.]